MIGIFVLCIKEKYYWFVIVFVEGGDGKLKGLCCLVFGLYMCDVLDKIDM